MLSTARTNTISTVRHAARYDVDYATPRVHCTRLKRPMCNVFCRAFWFFAKSQIGDTRLARVISSTRVIIIVSRVPGVVRVPFFRFRCARLRVPTRTAAYVKHRGRWTTTTVRFFSTCSFWTLSKRGLFKTFTSSSSANRVVSRWRKPINAFYPKELITAESRWYYCVYEYDTYYTRINAAAETSGKLLRFIRYR